MKTFYEDAVKNGIAPLGPFVEVQVVIDLKNEKTIEGVIYGPDVKEAIALCDLGDWLVIGKEHNGIMVVDKTEMRQIYFQEKAQNVFIKADNAWYLFAEEASK